MNTTKKFLHLPALLLLTAVIAGCGLQPTTTTDPQVEPVDTSPATETPWPWVTIPPDVVSTLPPTATMRPFTSPLQGRIAFQSDRDGSLEIYVMNADGSAVSRLTNNPAVDVFPSWSPDGSQIAFSSDRDGFPDIYLVNPDGSNLQRLTNSASTDVMPAWSPSGTELAFVSNRDGNDEIYVINIISGQETRITEDSSADYFPSWSEDGQWIVFTTDRDINPEIYKIQRDGSNLTRLTDEPGDDSNPSWSPDGSRIAFTSNRNGFYELYTMDTSGGNVIRITDFRSMLDEPSWSPDSNAIAFSSGKDGQNEIYILSTDGSRVSRLTDLPAADFYPAWSPPIGFLEVPIVAPTGAPEGVCLNSDDPTYGFTPENPIRIGYDPRAGHEGELSGGAEALDCLPWLLGPQGQELEISLLQEIEMNTIPLCEVAVRYAGNETPDILYFDTFNYEQPKAPLGYSCGSPIEYLKAITEALY